MAEDAGSSTRPRPHLDATWNSVSVSPAKFGSVTLCNIASSVSNLAVTEPPTPTLFPFPSAAVSEQDTYCCPSKKIRMISDAGDGVENSTPQHCNCPQQMEHCCDHGGRRCRQWEDRSSQGAGHLARVRLAGSIKGMHRRQTRPVDCGKSLAVRSDCDKSLAVRSDCDKSLAVRSDCSKSLAVRSDRGNTDLQQAEVSVSPALTGAGTSKTESAIWSKADTSKIESDNWMGAGTLKTESAIWTEAGTSKTESVVWTEAGTSKTESVIWSEAGTSKTESVIWSKAGTSKTETAVWTEAGTLKTPFLLKKEAVKEWYRHNSCCSNAAGEVKDCLHEGWNPANTRAAESVSWTAQQREKALENRGDRDKAGESCRNTQKAGVSWGDREKVGESWGDREKAGVNWRNDEGSEVSTVLASSAYHCHVMDSKHAGQSGSRGHSKLAGQSGSRGHSKLAGESGSREHTKLSGHTYRGAYDRQTELHDRQHKKLAGHRRAERRMESWCQWSIEGDTSSSSHLHPGTKGTEHHRPKSFTDEYTEGAAYGNSAAAVSDKGRTIHCGPKSSTDRVTCGPMSVADGVKGRAIHHRPKSSAERMTCGPVSVAVGDSNKTRRGPMSVSSGSDRESRAEHCGSVSSSDSDDDSDFLMCGESSSDSSSSASDSSPRQCSVASARIFHRRLSKCASTPSHSPHARACALDHQARWPGQEVTRPPRYGLQLDVLDDLIGVQKGGHSKNRHHPSTLSTYDKGVYSRWTRDYVTINDLPSILLVHIFSFLSIVTRLNLSLVCKKWQSAVLDPALWRCLDLRNLPRMTDDHLLRLASLSDRVACLVLSDGQATLLTDDGVTRVFRQCGYLTKIKLNRCFFLSDAAFESVGKYCCSVVYLNLSGCFTVTDRTLLAISQGCPLLEDLGLGQCSHITDAGVTAVARGCPRLTAFRADQCVKVTDPAVEALATYCPHLQFLHLLSCTLTDHGIAHLTKLRKLQVLDLSNVSQLSQKVLERVVECCPLLESLALSLNRRVDDYCIRSVVTTCPRLRRLSCVACGLSDLGLQFIATHARQLERLDVAWCADITDTGVMQVTTSCPRLRYLGLMRCPLVSMATVECLMHQHPNVHFSNFELESRCLIGRVTQQAVSSVPSSSSSSSCSW